MQFVSPELGELDLERYMGKALMEADAAGQAGLMQKMVWGRLGFSKLGGLSAEQEA
jgi:hypothetical protein